MERYALIFENVWQTVDFKSFVFVSVARKGVMGAFFVSVAGKGVTGFGWSTAQVGGKDAEGCANFIKHDNT